MCAFLINVAAIHTAFALPTTQFGGQIPEPSISVAKILSEKINDVQIMIIIDEISMIGSTTLARNDTRLRQIHQIVPC